MESEVIIKKGCSGKFGQNGQYSIYNIWFTNYIHVRRARGNNSHLKKLENCLLKVIRGQEEFLLQEKIGKIVYEWMISRGEWEVLKVQRVRKQLTLPFE